MNKNQKNNENKKLTRSFVIDETKNIDVEKRLVTLPFSSETPVKRWEGLEILDHTTEAVDLSRLNNAAAVLDMHNWDKQIGVVESAWLADDGRLYATLRFSQNPAAMEVFNDIVDGIKRNVSFGYDVLEKKVNEDEEEYHVTKWLPFEISLVSIPADPTVGVGRSLDETGDSENADEKPEPSKKIIIFTN